VRARVTRSPIKQRVMGASCVHRHLEAFYAPRVREGRVPVVTEPNM
jgi:hypothetical protein